MNPERTADILYKMVSGFYKIPKVEFLFLTLHMIIFLPGMLKISYEVTALWLSLPWSFGHKLGIKQDQELSLGTWIYNGVYIGKMVDKYTNPTTVNEAENS